MDQGIGPSSFFAGVCAGPYRVYVEDSFGNLSPVSSVTDLNFSSTTVGGTSLNAQTFFSDSACSIVGAQIAANASSADFFIDSATAGAMSLVVSASTIAQPGTRSLTVTEMAKLVFFANGFPVTSFDFGRVFVNSSSPVQLFTLKNISSGAAATNISLSVPGAPFAMAGNGTTCPSTPFNLSAGQGCALAVSFQPVTAGNAAGTMSADYTAATGQSWSTTSSVAMGLIGNGVPLPPPFVVLDVNLIDFGPIPVGSTLWSYITLTNIGGQIASNLFVTNVAFAQIQGFTVQSGSCQASLAPGASCRLKVMFQPWSCGPRSAAIGVTYDNEGITQPAGNVLLKGAGF